MPQFLAPILNDQQEDVNGNPLSGGRAKVYLAGSATPATTYNDKDGAVGHQNAWPIVFNTLGVNAQGAVWLPGGQAYKIVIEDSAGVLQRTLNDVSGINDSSTSVDQWVAFAGTPTFVSATSFTLPGDQTQTFPFGTRIKTTNTSGPVYSTVVRSVFASTTTTVTVINDSGSLDVGLSAVAVGLISPSNPSLPGTLTTPPFRNRFLNGGLRVDNRNGGAAVTVTAGAAIAYIQDRWYASCTGANVTIQRVAGTGYQNAVTITGAAANTGTLFGQRIESSNCFDWASKQVNVQVPISASGIAAVTWNAYVANATNDFSAKTLLATGTLALTGVIENKAFSFNAGANAARGIAVEFVTAALVSGQSITYQGAIQAEAGQLSPFEIVEIGEEVRRCARYLPSMLCPAGTEDVGWGGTISTSSALIGVVFQVEARVAPTGIASSGGFALTSMVASSALTSLLFGTASTRMARLTAAGTGTPYGASQPAILLANVANTRLYFTGCEL